MKREYHKWFSPALGREMELLVFGHAGARVLVFPTRGGRFYDYEDWGMVAALAHKIEQGWLQLFCVDSVDGESFYCREKPPRDRILRHLQYEAYLLGEVLPFTRYVNTDMCLITHGCSMGAFHAANLAFRHPGLVGKVVALSGRYDLTLEIGDFTDLFDGYRDDDVYFNTPCHFLPNVTDPSILSKYRRIEIHLAAGENDPFLKNNQLLSRILTSMGVTHKLHLWPGRAHRPQRWQEMVSMLL